MAGATTLNPWQQFQTSPAWRITLNTDGGTGKDLTGLLPSNLQLLIKSSSGADAYGQGAFTIVQAAAPAIVIYQPVRADSATAGSFSLWVIIGYGNGPDYVGPYQWSVNQS